MSLLNYIRRKCGPTAWVDDYEIKQSQERFAAWHQNYQKMCDVESRVEVPFELKLLNGQVSTPAYKTSGSVGLDLCANIDAPLKIWTDRVVKVPTGVAISINDGEYAGFVFIRSSLGAEGLTLANSVGVIDTDYQGEIFLALKFSGVNRYITIEPDQRIAQLVFLPVGQGVATLVTEFSNTTERGEAGFGSTGTH